MTKQTYNAVVLAADSVGAAGVARADTDDGDGRATQTNEGSDVRENDTKQAEKGRNGIRAGLEKRIPSDFDMIEDSL